MFDIARHFLGTNEQAFDLRIVGGGEVGAGVGVDSQASAGEEAEGRFLQTSLGNAETKFHWRASSSTGGAEAPSGNSWVKQDLDPVWQTLPSPKT